MSQSKGGAIQAAAFLGPAAAAPFPSGGLCPSQIPKDLEVLLRATFFGTIFMLVRSPQPGWKAWQSTALPCSTTPAHVPLPESFCGCSAAARAAGLCSPSLHHQTLGDFSLCLCLPEHLTGAPGPPTCPALQHGHGEEKCIQEQCPTSCVVRHWCHRAEGHWTCGLCWPACPLPAVSQPSLSPGNQAEC